MAHTCLQELNGHTFQLPPRYTVLKLVGTGTFGTVVCAYDELEQRYVAIKKIIDPFDFKVDREYQLRILREVLLLSSIRGCKNTVQLESLPVPPSESDFKDMYIVTNFVDTDLKTILSNRMLQLNEINAKTIMYGLLLGIKQIHDAAIIHRDVKPANVLVSTDLTNVSFCDFGLSCLEQDQCNTNTLNQISTLHYRAPELILSYKGYGKAVDMWGIGCIFAELLAARRPFFPGRDAKHQLDLILSVTGTPSDDQIFSCEKSKLYLKQLPKKTRADLSKLLPNADETAIDLLEKLLSFNPHTRITADEALKHPYLYGFESDIKNEQPINVRQIIKNAEQNSSVNIKNVIYEHCLQFNSEMEVAQGQIPCKTIAPEWEAKLCNRLDICGSRTEQYRKMIFEMAEEACCAMDRIYQEQDAADGRDVMTRFRSCENSGDEEKILRAQREVEKMLRIAVIKHRLDINV